MKDRLAKYSIQFSKEEVLPDLPKKIYDIHEVEMAPQQAQIYKQMQQDLLARIDDEEISVTNALTMMLRLAQITSGFVVIDSVMSDEGEELREKSTKAFDENPKLEAVREILAEKKPGEKTIIWACWRQDIAALKALCGDKAVVYYGSTSQEDREMAEWKFNCDPETTVFIGNPATAGVGLNLLGDYLKNPGDTNCDHVIYFSQDWSPIKRSQSEDRAHRRGVRQQVRITDLCIAGTIDETIRARVVEKRMNAMEISDIRSILKELLAC